MHRVPGQGLQGKRGNEFLRSASHDHPDARAPLLLVKADSVPAEVLAEIDRLGATTAYVVGGEAVVTPAARAQLTAAGLTIVPEPAPKS